MKMWTLIFLLQYCMLKLLLRIPVTKVEWAIEEIFILFFQILNIFVKHLVYFGHNFRQIRSLADPCG